MSLDFTTESLRYEKMLRDCNHLQGLALELHKARMDELGRYIKDLREKINALLPI
jgi:hypothetical protein